MNSTVYRDLRYRLAGPMAPLPILYQEDLSIDHAAIERYVDWLLVGGIKNVCFTFMFSEMDFLSTPELIEVTQTVADVVQDRGTFVACTAGGAAHEMVKTVNALHETGADTVMVHPPEWVMQGPGAGFMYVEYLRCALEQTDKPIMCCLLPEAQTKHQPLLTVDHFHQLVEYDNFIGMKDDIYVIPNRMDLIKTFSDRLCIVGGGDLRQYVLFHHYPCQGEFAGHFHPQLAIELFSLMDDNNYTEAMLNIESQIEKTAGLFKNAHFLTALHVCYYAMGFSDNYSIRPPGKTATREQADAIIRHIRKHPDIYTGTESSVLSAEA